MITVAQGIINNRTTVSPTDQVEGVGTRIRIDMTGIVNIMATEETIIVTIVMTVISQVAITDRNDLGMGVAGEIR